MSRILLIVVFFIVSCWATHAQNPHPAWRNYTTDHGLPSPEVHCIAQDSLGYMWFGTDNGLSRFDGYAFRNYGFEDGLTDNVILYLQVDSTGILWICTLSERIYYLKQDSIYPYPYNHLIQRYNKKFFANGGDFYVTNDGHLFTELPYFGILQIDENGNSYLYQSNYYGGVVAVDFGEKKVLNQTTFDEQRKNNDWLFKENEEPTPIELYRSPNTAPFIISGFRRPKGIFKMSAHKMGDKSYLISRKNRIFCIQNDTIEWVSAFDFNFGLNKSCLLDGDGSVILSAYEGTVNAGGLVYFANPDAIQRKQYDNWLKDEFATCIFKDQSGGLWVSTLDHGVFYSQTTDLDIYDVSSGLPDNHIRGIAIENEHIVYCGFKNGDVVRLGLQNHRLDNIPDFSKKGYINDMLFDHDRNTLIVSFNPGTGFYNNAKWEEYPNGKRITLCRNGAHLWSTSSNGFQGMDVSQKTYLFPGGLRDTNLLGRTLIVFEDRRNRVFLGRLDGLFEFMEDTLVRPEFMHPLLSLRVEDMAELPDGTMVIGSKGGGVLFWKGEQLEQVTTNDGLTANMIENVHVDERGQVWVGTLEGLNKVVRLAKDSFSVKQYTIHHGLPSNEINRVKTRGRHVWVATTNGLVHFEDDEHINVQAKPPFIEYVLVNNVLLEKESRHAFSYGENNFSINYLTLDFRQIGNINYRYRLLPSQSDWIYTKVRNVNFAALQPNDYSFEVQSQNEDGFWSNSATFDFTVLPPFWQTWWFIAVSLAATGFFVFSIYKYRTNQIRQEAAIVRQMAEIERTSLRAQMNPHFIFNSLNAIQGYIATGDKREANRYLSRFARLIRSVLQHSRLTKVSLEEDIASLRKYLELEKMRFADKFDFEITIDQQVNVGDIEIPPMLVQPFVENAIVHGIANNKSKGLVEIDYRLSGKTLVVTVTDNGIGIEASKKMKGRLVSSHKSIGITVTNRRLEMLSTNDQTGRVETKELKGEDGQAAGTQVKVWIPVEGV